MIFDKFQLESSINLDKALEKEGYTTVHFDDILDGVGNAMIEKASFIIIDLEN